MDKNVPELYALRNYLINLYLVIQKKSPFVYTGTLLYSLYDS